MGLKSLNNNITTTHRVNDVFCCKYIESLVSDPLSPLEYDPITRAYYLVAIPKGLRKKNEVTIAFDIEYCPRCATKLPESLEEKWSMIIKRKFKLSGLLTEKQKKLIPEEYKTDEWWKKRGL